MGHQAQKLIATPLEPLFKYSFNLLNKHQDRKTENKSPNFSTPCNNTGTGGVAERLKLGFEFAEQLLQALVAEPTIRLLSPVPSETLPSLKEALTTPITSSQLMETVSSTVVFQYIPQGLKQGRNSEYYDNLNSWVNIQLCHNV